MDKEIFFVDYVSIEQPGSTQALSDAKQILTVDKPVSLKVVMDATHSGTLTNRRVYPAKKVLAGYKTFFSKDDGGDSPFGKPILMHHDSHADAIGRIKTAEFKALKTGTEFDKDYLFPDMVGGKGSGVVTVHAIITDKDAIQKILDGRYLSVSAGHSTDQMFCSICGQSLYGDECTHVPGVKYDDEGEPTEQEDARLCYGITNNLTYHELSFVNTPAQPHAKIVELDWREGKDSVKQEIANRKALLSVGRAKKDTVHSLSLLTDEVEFSLLTGKDKPNKIKTYSVPTSTAEILRSKLEEGNNVKDESLDDRLSSSKASTAKIVEVQKTEDKEEKIEKTEDKQEATSAAIVKKEKTDMDAEQLKAQLDKLSAEMETLRASLATADKEKTELKSAIVAKDSEITSLQTAVSSLKTDMTQYLATALASYRIRLGKPETKGLDSEDAKKKYVETLSKRSTESLKDSINDILVELQQAEKDQTVESKDSNLEVTDAADILEGKKVESTTLNVDNGKKKLNKKDVQVKDILATLN